MNTATLEQLQRLVVQFCEEREWSQFHNPKDMAISLSLESSELLEHFQWKNAEEVAQHITSKKDEISNELSDVLYWTLLIANNLNIDLAKSFTDKLAINAAKYPVEKAKGTHKKYTEL